MPPSLETSFKADSQARRPAHTVPGLDNKNPQTHIGTSILITMSFLTSPFQQLLGYFQEEGNY